MVNPQAADTCSACGGELSRERGTGGLCPGCLMELGFESAGPFDPDAGLDDTETVAYRPDALAQGQVLGNRYRIRALLGRGGMGEVWRAVDLKLRVEVALKALRSRLSTDERALETLRQEVRMAREVVSPNVCRVFDLVELEGQELVSMEYIDGITLWDILRARSPLPLSEAREIAAQFLAGLEAIHEAGLVHRDVKPENLMMTRAGRVVLMDFGIAKGLAEGRTGTVSGTPAYMAPEQGRGEAADARADVFSAGVVLAEMIAPGGLATLEARQAVWHGIHGEPPSLRETPWRPVLEKAVARMPEHRFPSAAALARALEEVTLRVERAEDVTPYPGLASFTREDTDYFFGRELEVEEMWKKLRRPHLLGLIGPSGAGKSSFLRAGLLAVTPTGWRAVITTPGIQPFANLAGALVPEVSGDTESLQLLVHSDDPDSVSKVIANWRRQHDEVLIVLDQFEELFTLNPPEVQERFAALVARLALEADAHVLLAMRDDFLFHCQYFEPLSPIFTELTPIGAPKGTALRRALVQPALKCGYRFQDDALVNEMVAEVATERGALPMLAFAAARLWEHRDRHEGLLTREAYDHIGGVGGALAQHAEKTLEKIGQDRVPIVRELFRNLVTAQGTRAARTRDDLLSVFEQQETAGGHRAPKARGRAGRFGGRGTTRMASDASETKRPGSVPAEVLDTLIDARLLTSYELPATDDEGSPQQRIEIIHESLLSNWPRLVRWQAQDEEGAILRDQLRQAAQMWEERGHPEDLVWTGTSFNEFQLWRERYAGGLSTTEEGFAKAMTVKAERRKRRRRLAVAGAFTILLAVLAVVFASRQEARSQTLRAEANQLLALGRLELDNHPTGALAYALASLERADERVTRLFALESLWRGRPALLADFQETLTVDFSPDGRWLAGSNRLGDTRASEVKLWSSAGGTPTIIQLPDIGNSRQLRFSAQSEVMALVNYEQKVAYLISVPGGELVRTIPISSDGKPDIRLSAHSGRLLTFAQHGSLTRVMGFPLDGSPPVGYGDLAGGLAIFANFNMPWAVAIDPDGSHLAFAPEHVMNPSGEIDSQVYVAPLSGLSRASSRLVGRHQAGITAVAFDPGGDRLASADNSVEIRIWSLTEDGDLPLRVLHQPRQLIPSIRFDSSGSRLATAGVKSHAALWHLEGPPDAGPQQLLRSYRGNSGASEVAFHPQGSWMVTAGRGLAAWPLERPYPLDLEGHEMVVRDLAFLPDGRSLVSTSNDGTLRLWPLSAAAGSGSRVLYETGGSILSGLKVHPDGRQLLVGEATGDVWLISVDSGQPRRLGEIGTHAWATALGPRGRLAAAASKYAGHPIRIWDLETGMTRDLDSRAAMTDLRFTPDGRLISVGLEDGIRIWDLDDGTSQRLSERGGMIDLSPDGRRLLAQNQVGREPSLLDLETGTWTHLEGHGPSSCAVLDTGGSIAATIKNGTVWLQVGAATAAAPHLLIGSENLSCPVFSPDGRWVASGHGNDIRLWPVPDLTLPPLHTLHLDELLAKLRTLTNLRVVPDPESETGWGWALDPFPGWEEVPTW